MDTEALFSKRTKFQLNLAPLIVVAFLSVSITDAGESCDMSVIGSLVGGSVRQVEVVGDIAYLTTPNLYIFDISDPTDPQLMSSLDGIFSNALTVSGDYLYVGNVDGWYVIDVSNPLNPTQVAFVKLNRPLITHIKDNYAYVMADAEGIKIYNVSDPANPVFVADGPDGGLNEDFDVEGDKLVLASSVDNITIVDISDPTTPVTIVQSFGTPKDADALDLVGNLLYLSTDVDHSAPEFFIYDIANPAAPALVGSLDVVAFVHDVQVFGDTAYLIRNANGPLVVDVSNPSAPQLLGKIPLSFGDAYDLDVEGDLTILAADEEDLVLFDVSSTPTGDFVGQSILPTDVRDLVIEGDIAILGTADSALTLMDISDPSTMRVISAQGLSEGLPKTQMFRHEDMVYARGGAVVEAVDISNPLEPVHLDGFYPDDLLAFSIVNSGTNVFAIVASDLEPTPVGLRIIDYSDPLNPQIIGALDDPGLRAAPLSVSSPRMAVEDGVLFLANGEKLISVDVSEPTSPTIVGELTLNGVSGITVQDSIAYLLGTEFLTVDVSDPANPQLLGSTSPSSGGILVVGNRTFVGGKSVYDISDLTNPQLLQTIAIGGASRGTPHLVGETLYAGTSWGIFAIDVSSCLASSAGDCDGDGDLDLTDFGQFQLCFTGPGGTAGPECACADFDGDNDIDLADFNAFQLGFTGPM
jgi:hypothetical protein